MSLRRNQLFALSLIVGMFFLMLLLMTIVPGMSSGTVAKAAENVPDAPGSVSGYVRDRKGNPIKDVNVTIFSDRNSISTFTDISGYYRFALMPPDEYFVSFREHPGFLDGYYLNSATLEGATRIQVQGNNLENIDANLMKESMISGTISFAGSPITTTSFIYVRAYKFDTQSSVWQSQGNESQNSGSEYVIRGLSAGTYRVCALVYSDSYPSTSSYCYGNASYVAGGKDVVVGDEETRSGIDIVFQDNPDYATISGRVLDTSGNPISGTVVDASPHTALGTVASLDPLASNSYSAITNEDGEYKIDTLVPNVVSYIITFDGNNGNYFSEYYDNVKTVAEAKKFTFQVRQVISNVNAVLDRAAHINGTITLQGGAPFRNGLVLLSHFDNQEWQGLKTSSIDRTTGNYSLSGLLTGTYRVCAEFYFGTQQLTNCYGAKTVVSATDISLIAGEVRNGINFDVSTNTFEGRISGQVNANDIPLADMRVELINSPANFPLCDNRPKDYSLSRKIQLNFPDSISQPDSIHTTTDAQGNYMFEGLPPNLYLIKVSDPTYRYGTNFYKETSAAQSYSLLYIDCGQIRGGVNVSMTKSSAVSGRITDASRIPLSNTKISLTWVNLYGSHVTDQVTVTDVSGNYVVRGVAPGVYWLRADYGEFEPGLYVLSEYYGASENNNYSPQQITVTSGITTTGIDIILGPDNIVWLPVISRE